MIAILNDVTKCTGCERCVAACTKANHLPDRVAYPWSKGDGLSAERFTSIVRFKGRYVRKQCRHCVEPACASACPVAALRKTPEGPVIYDEDRCLGCRYCMMACPFGIPRYQWESPAPYVRKCTMCYETRIKNGQPPACTEACPNKATIFGDRDELMGRARSLAAASAGALTVYGDTEVGGTCVIYLAPPGLNLAVGGPVPSGSLPKLTATAMAAVPPVFVGVGALMGGLSWVIGRRQRLQSEASVSPEEKDKKA
jgi:formate dehydrogenase iron-sulfur subunit